MSRAVTWICCCFLLGHMYSFKSHWFYPKYGGFTSMMMIMRILRIKMVRTLWFHLFGEQERHDLEEVAALEEETQDAGRVWGICSYQATSSLRYSQKVLGNKKFKVFMKNIRQQLFKYQTNTITKLSAWIDLPFRKNTTLQLCFYF